MWVNRLLALGIVFGFVGILHATAPDPAEREHWLFLVALPVGYGHLLGGLLFSRRQAGPSDVWSFEIVRCLFFVSVSLSLLALYTWALQGERLGPLVVSALLFVAAWHIAENDRQLHHAYRNGLRLRRRPLSWFETSRVVLVVAAILLASMATPAGSQLSDHFLGGSHLPAWTTIPDLATVVLLYHAVSWAIFFLDRARFASPARARGIRRRLFAVHLVPLGINTASYLWMDSLFAVLATPTLFLFWSSLHAIQTAAGRRPAVRSV